MMRTRLIVEHGLKATADGASLSIRLPWYRTLPLSVIDMPVIKIDGVAVGTNAVTLEVNGGIYNATSAREAIDVWWYVLDPGTLHIAGLTVESGKNHEITVEVSFAPPYIPEITLFCAATKTMIVEQAGTEQKR
jgi:hypothetical protein